MHPHFTELPKCVIKIVEKICTASKPAVYYIKKYLIQSYISIIFIEKELKKENRQKNITSNYKNRKMRKKTKTTGNLLFLYSRHRGIVQQEKYEITTKIMWLHHTFLSRLRNKPVHAKTEKRRQRTKKEDKEK